MISIFDLFHDERRYGWIVDKHYDWINMLEQMKRSKPQRFGEFDYSQSTIYHYLDKIQQQQNLHD